MNPLDFGGADLGSSSAQNIGATNFGGVGGVNVGGAVRGTPFYLSNEKMLLGPAVLVIAYLLLSKTKKSKK